MILISLAASAVGVWLVDRYDPDAPDNDDETKLAWTGLGLCVAGPIVFGYGVYSLPGEGSAKKKKDFFMRYQHYDFSSRFLPGSGFLAFGVRLKL